MPLMRAPALGCSHRTRTVAAPTTNTKRKGCSREASTSADQAESSIRGPRLCRGLNAPGRPAGIPRRSRLGDPPAPGRQLEAAEDAQATARAARELLSEREEVAARRTLHRAEQHHRNAALQVIAAEYAAAAGERCAALTTELGATFAALAWITGQRASLPPGAVGLPELRHVAAVHWPGASAATAQATTAMTGRWRRCWLILARGFRSSWADTKRAGEPALSSHVMRSIPRRHCRVVGAVNEVSQRPDALGGCNDRRTARTSGSCSLTTKIAPACTWNLSAG